LVRTSNSVPLVGGDRKAFGARRFAFPALAAMSAFSDFAPSFETPAASDFATSRILPKLRRRLRRTRSSDRSASPAEVIGDWKFTLPDVSYFDAHQIIPLAESVTELSPGWRLCGTLG
jgi:hypothetical protein